jgi:hypothetical protein
MYEQQFDYCLSSYGPQTVTMKSEVFEESYLNCLFPNYDDNDKI